LTRFDEKAGWRSEAAISEVSSPSFEMPLARLLRKKCDGVALFVCRLSHMLKFGASSRQLFGLILRRIARSVSKEAPRILLFAYSFKRRPGRRAASIQKPLVSEVSQQKQRGGKIRPSRSSPSLTC